MQYGVQRRNGQFAHIHFSQHNLPKFIPQTKSSILFCPKYPSVMSRWTDTSQAVKSHKRGCCWGDRTISNLCYSFPSLKQNTHQTLLFEFQKEVIFTRVFKPTCVNLTILTMYKTSAFHSCCFKCVYFYFWLWFMDADERWNSPDTPRGGVSTILHSQSDIIVYCSNTYSNSSPFSTLIYVLKFKLSQYQFYPIR